MKTKPIDVLILETALRNGVVTAFTLAPMWGEDEARVAGWLKKFYRIGLMHRNANLYWILQDEAEKYLAQRRQPIP